MSVSNHSNNSPSSSKTRSEQPPILCHHNEPAPLRTVRFNNGPNVGRQFYGCAHWPGSCGFIKWVDEVDEMRHLMESATERTVRELLISDQKKQQQIEELAIESDMMREGMYSAKADRKLLFVCLMFWIVFWLAFMFKN